MREQSRFVWPSSQKLGSTIEEKKYLPWNVQITDDKVIGVFQLPFATRAIRVYPDPVNRPSNPDGTVFVQNRKSNSRAVHTRTADPQLKRKGLTLSRTARVWLVSVTI